MAYRWDVLNQIAQRIGARRYLEIGVDSGECLRHVGIAERWAVDPSPQISAVQASTVFVPWTSDEFFREVAPRAGHFDLVFIDGLHHAEQVDRDIQGALKVLSPTGVVCLHDCNPTKEAMQIVPPIQGEWTGDCWKAIARLRTEGLHQVGVVDTDYGIGVVCPDRGSTPIELPRPWEALTWADLQAHRAALLGLVPLRRWTEWFESAYATPRD